MCGFSGFWNPRGCRPEAAEAALAAMTARIAHRGPDGQGAWSDAKTGIGLGFRRLAILDLTPEGDQPMVSASGRMVLVFNGEIYNHGALRSQLPGGCARRSDTAAVLAAFEYWGVAATLPRLRGMFALALWDLQEQCLYLARDRAGEKPLYYGWSQGVLLFGSELEALRGYPGWTGAIDRDALAQYFRWGSIPAPQTIYQHFHKLAPACWLRFRRPDEAPAPAQYWTLPEAAGTDARGPEELGQELEALLRSAVSEQMVADVPVGAFLSGGIDSSLITALMQAAASKPIQTFSVGFQEAQFDEAPHAAAVAAYLGTEHHELRVSADQAREAIPEVARIYDEPFADSSQIPTFLLARLARSRVTVALSGDGGDELFGGYQRYSQGKRAWRVLGRLPTFVGRAAAGLIRGVEPEGWDRLAGAVPGLGRGALCGDRLHKVADLVEQPTAAAFYEALMGTWVGATPVLGGDGGALGSAGIRVRATRQEFLALAMTWDFLQYLPDDILVKVDRAAMAVSLETRIPLLDHRIIEFARGVPLQWDLRAGQGKWLLRRLLYRFVPEGLVNRPKMGFGIPLGAWLRGPLRDWAEETLSPSRLRDDGFLRPEAIQAKWREHLAGHRNWQRHLWAALVWQSWYSRRSDSVGLPAIPGAGSLPASGLAAGGRPRPVHSWKPA